MTDPLKVAYYLPRFPKLSETFILREMGMLRNLGVDVQIFSLFSPKSTSTMHQQTQYLLPYTHYSPLFSFKILSAQLYFILKHPRRYFRALWNAIWQTLPEPKTFLMALILFPKSVYFARQLEEMNVVHVHAHFVWLNGISAQVASDLLGISSSLHAHAWDIFRRKTECVRRQIELSSLVVTISAYHKRYLLDLCRDGHQSDVRVVHYGIDPFEFTPTAVSTKNSEIELISVGRLVEKKGFRYLIDACAILAKQGLTFHCSIVGDGQRDSLLFQIEDLGLQDKVSLLGPKNITEILKLYQISDIFVLPCVIAKSGDRDGMPNVLLEAMAMQIPVITTPVTGNCELVQDGINGMIVPERDSVALASAIETLMLNPDLRNAIGTQGRQTILSGFDIHSTAAEMRDLFQEMNSLK